jgi:hypothetical protein
MSRTPIHCLALVIALASLSAGLGARSGHVSAQMVTSEVSVANGVADATFTIEVTNGAPTAASNVRVVFADGAEVSVGEVAAESKASSDSQRRVIDVSASPSRNFPIAATLKYSQDGEDVETSIVLTVRIG